MAERLRGETSPYLLQHADNPVDWWPWSDAAFAAAAERDVPVLLSVGYSACHWCHVMAHESFENEHTAALMNEHLVAIKVDREERPDVDSVYMTATQAMTGQGGWPMTVFMTPDREPFFCGTYFPREQFERLVLGVTRAWQEDRAQVAAQAGQIAAALSERAGQPVGGPLAGADQGLAAFGGATADQAGDAAKDVLAAACDAAVATLSREFDAAQGGFGGAPKFPPSMVLEFLLRHAERGAGQRSEPSPEAVSRGQAATMAEVTAEAMARGGMYDQLGGGFARYSVDAGWVIPHFEKMLYDNALLARCYAHWWRRTGSGLARRIAVETCDFLLAEMRTDQGGFAAALDADSGGVEGAFYVWTPDQLAAVLGPDDGARAADLFGVTPGGTFEHGASVLQLRRDSADEDWLAGVRARLLAARAERIRPGRDDKVVAAWNGLAIAALAETGLLAGRPDFIAAAGTAADLLVRVHLADGRLTRTSRDGRSSGTAGVLDDYGCVAEGLLALASVSPADEQPAAGSAGPARWLGLAGDLLDVVLTRFGAGTGGFYDTADDSEQLIYRPADIADGPSPSGTFAVAGAMLRYAALTGSARHREAAQAALGGLPDLAGRFPRAVGWGLAVAEAVLSGPVEIAVAGPPTPARAELHRAALVAAPPGAVIACGVGASEPGSHDPGPAGGAGSDGQIPLLAGRGAVGGSPAAYVCRDFVCQLPVTDPAQLRAALA
ncbi:MAG TPA: thioredoxin domain-containing protein [Streptosporangiaceae bacterium]